MPERERGNGAIFGFRHENNGVQDAGNRSGGKDRREDTTVRRCEVIQQQRGGMWVRGDARDVEDAPSALVRFFERHGAKCKPAAASRPLDTVKACARFPPASDPGPSVVLAGGDFVCEFGDEELFEFLVSTSADKGGYKSATGGAGDDGREEIRIKVGFYDAKVVVAGVKNEYVCTLSDECKGTYAKEAPPLRHSAVRP